MPIKRRPWKNYLVGATMSAMVLGVSAVSIVPTADAANQPMTATATVNMRSGPGTSHGVIAVLSPKQQVTTTGNTSGSWYEVVAGSRTGWVFKDYLAAATQSTPAASSTTNGSVTTTGSVNVRTGPGLNYSVVTTVPRNTTLKTTGEKTAEWTQVIHADKAQWMFSQFLVGGKTTQLVTTGSVTTTGSVNVRTGPGLNYSVVTTVPRNTTLKTTGEKTAEWTQVIHADKAQWMFSQFLTAGKQSLPAVTGQVKTTANLYLRTGGDLSHPYTGVLPGNSIVDVTGRTTSDYTEIIHSGATRWIATRYTTSSSASKPSTPSTPKATGKVWVNVGSLYLRATSASNGKIVTTVYRGTELPTTGVTSGDRTQVIHQGVARWAYTAYLSKTAPAPAPKGVTLNGYDRLNANSKAVVAAVVANFPKVNTIHGWRASSDYSSDHPNGRAVDIMISDWKGSGVQYGTDVASYFQKHSGKYKVRYLIWRQKIWNADYPTRGWRAMEDRGSATANHYDHVHVSVRD